MTSGAAAIVSSPEKDLARLSVVGGSNDGDGSEIAAAAVSTTAKKTKEKMANDGGGAAAVAGGGEAVPSEESAAAAVEATASSDSSPAVPAPVLRTVTLPTTALTSTRWGPDRASFAAKTSLPRYDETDEEAASHDELELRIIAATAAREKALSSSVRSSRANSSSASLRGSTTVGGGSKRGGGGLRGFGRSLSRGSTPNSSQHGVSGSIQGGGNGDANSERSENGAPTASLASLSAIEVPDNPVPPTSWTPISGTKFSVRSGPNYKKTGKKSPSAESLYETCAVRCYRSDRRTEDVADVLPLPLDEIYGSGSGGNEDGGEGGEEGGGAPKEIALPNLGCGRGAGGKDVFVPDVLIYHVQLPYESPNMFKQKDDGTGGEIVFYLKPSRRFVDEVTGAQPLTPAARHFVRWCQNADSDLSVSSLFKCMALVRNLDRHNLGWLNPYNGKPVLITESGRARRGTTAEGLKFLEMRANVHKWAFLAKKGFVGLIPKFRDMRIDVGWTIEAGADADLPECILGAVGMNYMDESKFLKIEGTMQGKCQGSGNVEVVAPKAAAAARNNKSMRSSAKGEKAPK